MLHRVSRRRFLKTAALAGAAGFWSGRLSGEEKKLAANERLQVGVVGITNRGEANIQGLVGAQAEIVALCDVDEARSAKVRARFPQASFHIDFRKLLDQKGLDAVLIATPDHTHAIPTLAALRAGLHVYCEKPLTHTIEEARLVAETAVKHKRVTQMGTQIHAGANYRRCVELIQANAIGPVREVHVWCGRSWGGPSRPKESEPIPLTLHWNLWLGPAPERPYHHGPNKSVNGTYHPYNWRHWWDFGGGTLADMACHYMDLPFWALQLRHPTKVSAEGAPLHPESAADWLIVRYEYPARRDLPPVKLTWYDGGKRPKLFDEGKLPKWGDGVLFVGDKGMLLADYNKRLLLPEKQYEGFTASAPTIADSIGHHREWVEACKSGGATTCNFDYSGALTEAALLGNVSYRLGKPLQWDARALKATNEPGADQFIRKEYRKPWKLA